MQKSSSLTWRSKLHETIYESNTTAGKVFDIVLLLLITASIVVVMLDSIKSINQQYGSLFYILEWTFTVLFTIEYILRLICIQRPLLYVTSSLGIIDLLALIPPLSQHIFCRRPFTAGFTCPALAAHLPHIQACPFHYRNAISPNCYFQQLKKDQHFYAGGANTCHHPWLCHVLGRRACQRFQQHSRLDLLGHCYHHHCWIWRYLTCYTTRQIHCVYNDVHWLWNYCCAHGYTNYRYCNCCTQ